VVIAVVVLGVVAVGLTIALVMVERRRRRAVAAGNAADQRTTAVKADLTATRAELGERQSDLVTAQADLEISRAQLSDVQQQAGALGLELEVSHQEIDRLGDQVRRATSGHDATSLWELELQRSERTWRYHVAPGLDSSSPLVDVPDQLRVAVGIEASALREESGTAVDVEWNLQRPIGPGPCLAVLRYVQEQLAGFAKRSDRVLVRVTDEGRQVKTEVVLVGDHEPGPDEAPVAHYVECDEVA
jgi:hypothetical protein